MRKRILDYLNRINQLLGEAGANTDWNAILSEHLEQVRFFQHERLVHLIVTATFALVLMMLMILFNNIEQVSILAVIFFVFVVVMLLAYLFHYYILETSVQKMYRQYDEILLKIRKESAITTR